MEQLPRFNAESLLALSVVGEKGCSMWSLCAVNRNSKYVGLIGSACSIMLFNWKWSIKNILFRDLNIQFK